MAAADLISAPKCKYNHPAHFSVDKKRAFRELVIIQQRLASALRKLESGDDPERGRWYWMCEVQYCRQKIKNYMAEHDLNPKLVKK